MRLSHVIGIFVTMLATGCSTVPMVQLRIDSPWVNSIQADGFSAPDGAEDSNLYDLLLVDLQKALPFIFVFQDGYRASSKEITAELLTKHHAPLEPGFNGKMVSTTGGGSAVGDKEYWSVAFFLGSDGHASTLMLQSCNHLTHQLLGTPDGSQVFDFPIRQREIAALFGPPTRTLHFKAILLDKCRF